MCISWKILRIAFVVCLYTVWPFPTVHAMVPVNTQKMDRGMGSFECFAWYRLQSLVHLRAFSRAGLKNDNCRALVAVFLFVPRLQRCREFICVFVGRTSKNRGEWYVLVAFTGFVPAVSRALRWCWVTSPPLSAFYLCEYPYRIKYKPK